MLLQIYVVSSFGCFVCDLSLLLLIATYWVNKRCFITKVRYCSNDFSYISFEYSLEEKNNYELFKLQEAKLSIEFLKLLENKDEFMDYLNYITKEVSLNQLLAFNELVQFETFVADHIQNN